ncbi:MAG: hypothetical protein QOE24_1983 [Frankiales bacterium]|nr:hypothetical protein [Frankiales bacterium]
MAALRRNRWQHLPLVILALLALLAAIALMPFGGSARAASTLLSQGKPTTASSTENAGTPAASATDGNTGTRWSSAFSDPQWIQVDLGATSSITQVVLNWEAAYGTAFQIQTSADATTWTSIYTTTTGTGGVQTLNVTGSGRYVRLYGTARGTAYGYSLWELQVFGSVGTTGSCGTANAAQGRPAVASSTENATFPASAAVDGNTGTRWSSAFSDPQWIYVDLGSTQTVCKVTLNWEPAYAKSFQLQTSNDSTTWTSIYTTTTGTGGVQTLTVNGSGRYLRMYGTARATAYGYSLWELGVNVIGSVTTTTPTPTTTSGGGSFGGFPASFWGNTATIPAATQVLELQILNRTNGQYPDSQVYYSFNGTTYNVATNPYFDMPVNSSGRMYFYLGSPTSQYQDFIEFTIGAAQFNGNTTRVDAWALPLVMHLHNHDGSDQTVGDSYQVFNETRDATFNRFVAAVPAEFKALAQAPYYPTHIIAPGSLPAFQPGGANQNYMSSYASQFGVSATTQQIFGCSGTLGADPVNCANANRHVLGTSTAVQNDPTQYYKSAPANYYAKFWHDNAVNNLAYGFPYDDDAGQSSYISHASPQYLQVAVGW